MTIGLNLAFYRIIQQLNIVGKMAIKYMIFLLEVKIIKNRFLNSKVELIWVSIKRQKLIFTIEAKLKKLKRFFKNIYGRIIKNNYVFSFLFLKTINQSNP